MFSFRKSARKKFRKENKREKERETWIPTEKMKGSFEMSLLMWLDRCSTTLLEKINTCLLTAKRQGQCFSPWCCTSGRISAGQKPKSVKTRYTTILELNYMFATIKHSCSSPEIIEFRGDLKTRSIKFESWVSWGQ